MWGTEVPEGGNWWPHRSLGPHKSWGEGAQGDPDPKAGFRDSKAGGVAVAKKRLRNAKRGLGPHGRSLGIPEVGTGSQRRGLGTPERRLRTCGKGRGK